MDTPGVALAEVWKRFRRGEFHDSLRDLIPALSGRMLRRRGADRAKRAGEFWALRDVSFSVGPGEALGIIGPNGAGKSTILKILTRILTPERGRVHVRGRIGALIEVAAGFHPDLTGRENIFLQGAIMGMQKAQIRARFDEIAAFSGLEDFLETPVKRYSSGMNARLGFAIAAHLDPDVLIVDEVLAVGDFRFQASAFERIKHLVGTGLPVVVVSHQLDKVAELCTSAILLEQGRIVHRGAPEACISRYLEETMEGASATDEPNPIRIHDLRLPDGARVRSGDDLRLTVEVSVTDGGIPQATEALAIVVRSSRSGTVMAAVPAGAYGVDVEGPGTAVEAVLQMNVPPGLYSLETVTWDRHAWRPVSRGPTAVVVVEEGAFFRGDVQLNARMRVMERSAQPR